MQIFFPISNFISIDEYTGFDIFLFIFGLIFIFLIFVTYSFQYLKIIKNKNVKSISHKSILIGNISNICILINTLIFYFPIIKECSYIEYINCINSSIGLYQMISQFICYILLYYLFALYYKTNENNANYNLINYNSINDDYNKKNSNISMLSFAISMLLNIIILIITILLLSLNNWENYENILIITYGRTMGILGTIFIIIQFLPQIYKLYINKCQGSLSKITSFLLAIGNIIPFFYIIISSTSDVTTYLPYIISFILQSIIFCQIVYYEKKTKKQNEILSSFYRNSSCYISENSRYNHSP